MMRPLLKAMLVPAALGLLAVPRVSASEPAPVSLSQADQAKLIEALGSDRPLKVRLQAAIILGRVGGQDAVPALIDCLGNDADYPVRGGCALALGNLGSLKAVEPLVGAMDDSESFVREEAQRSLKKLARPEALPYLEAARESGSPRVRLALADIASTLRPTEASTLLMELIGDSDERVRQSAEKVIEGLDDATASAVLLKGLDHPNFRVKARAANHLGKRKDPKALDRLADLAANSLEAAEVQDSARVALRALKDNIAVAPLSSVAHDASKDRKDRSHALVLLAAKTGDADALQACLDLLNDTDEQMRGASAQALAELGDPRALPPLREAQAKAENAKIGKVIAVSIRKLERGGGLSTNP